MPLIRAATPIGDPRDAAPRLTEVLASAEVVAAEDEIEETDRIPDRLRDQAAAMGLFGATLMPATLALLRTTFLDRGQRRLAVAIWATAFSVGAAAGPVVGGLILNTLSWRWLFLVNVPIVHFSVNWWNTLHQPATFSLVERPPMPAAMWLPLLVMVLPTLV